MTTTEQTAPPITDAGGADLPPAKTRQLLVYLTAAHMAAGAGAHEAAADVARVAHAMGLRAPQIRADPNGVTLSLGHGEPATYETVEGSFRLDQTARVTAIQHALETGETTPAEALEYLKGLRRQKPRFPVVGMYLGGVVVAMGIAGILQPTWPSILFAAAASPVTVALIRLTGRRLLPAALLPLVASFLIASAAFWAYEHGIIHSPLRTMLPPVAVLLPGAVIVTGLSELVAGVMVTGAARLAYGATQLVMFAVGVGGAALWLNPGDQAFTNARLDDLGPVAGFVGLCSLTVGICLMESVPKRLAPGVLAVTTATYVVQWAVQTDIGSPWGGAFAGAFTATVAAWTIALLRPDMSRLVLFLPSFWLLVPGSLGLVTVTQFGVHPQEAWPTAMTATSVIIAIALGLVFGTNAARGVQVALRRTRAGVSRSSR